jgi:hypothetical protein
MRRTGSPQHPPGATPAGDFETTLDTTCRVATPDPLYIAYSMARLPHSCCSPVRVCGLFDAITAVLSVAIRFARLDFDLRILLGRRLYDHGGR